MMIGGLGQALPLLKGIAGLHLGTASPAGSPQPRVLNPSLTNVGFRYLTMCQSRLGWVAQQFSYVCLDV